MGMKLLNITSALFTRSPRLKPQDCAERVRNGDAILIDVRETPEWERGVAEGAVPLSFRDFVSARAQWKPFLATVGNRELLFYCAAGVRAGIAARVLAREGFRTANTGSLSDWRSAGWPIVNPPTKGSM